MRRRGPGQASRWSIAALVLAVVVVLGIAGYALTSNKPVAGAGQVVGYTPPPPTPDPVTVAFVGDSFSGGSAMSSGYTHVWPWIVATDLGWAKQNFALGGTGYLRSSVQGPPFMGDLAKVVAYQPNFVVVAGGHNDYDVYPTNDIVTAAQAYLTALHKALPKAKIVLLGSFASGPPPPKVVALNQALPAVATSVGATYIDVSDMFSGSYASLIGSDGTHPTDAGHLHMAAILEPQLLKASKEIPLPSASN